MRKVWAVLAVILGGAGLQAAGQTACPMALTEGHWKGDSVDVLLRNRGKVPIEQFSLVCRPSAGRGARGGVCHTETGVFYPGTPYRILFPYSGTERHEVTISVNTAQLAGGVLWTSRSSDSCRTLRVERGR